MLNLVILQFAVKKILKSLERVVPMRSLSKIRLDFWQTKATLLHWMFLFQYIGIIKHVNF